MRPLRGWRRAAVLSAWPFLVVAALVWGLWRHAQTDARLRLLVVELQEQVKVQEAMLRLAEDRGSGAEIHLANVPPATLSYELLLRPVPRRVPR